LTGSSTGVTIGTEDVAVGTSVGGSVGKGVNVAVGVTAWVSVGGIVGVAVGSDAGRLQDASSSVIMRLRTIKRDFIGPPFTIEKFPGWQNCQQIGILAVLSYNDAWRDL
jgi:hypothetical protein